MVWWKLFHCPWCWSADWNPILLFEAGLTLKRPWLLLFVSALFIGHDFHYFLCSCIFPPISTTFCFFYRDECSVQIDLTMKYTIYKNHVNYQNNTLIITHLHSVFSLSFLTRQPCLTDLSLFQMRALNSTCFMAIIPSFPNDTLNASIRMSNRERILLPNMPSFEIAHSWVWMSGYTSFIFYPLSDAVAW